MRSLKNDFFSQINVKPSSVNRRWKLNEKIENDDVIDVSFQSCLKLAMKFPNFFAKFFSKKQNTAAGKNT